ncbi:carbon monoxide dehydrogenase [Anaerostipes sp. MSJ-23]|uniref:carbon monoxide dehydrogenase n=1 Tax=Anaerostipes sp. MSJ-23 TaxID=2841520 RepID=UPI001C11B7D4|nr:carbon monoxide dehydrogenase [Anaerostipes sp. MSJ-23]MBU5460825.1 carbon monoxide dehydrogenase [Anaerostipes sp. MSJ-23]
MAYDIRHEHHNSQAHQETTIPEHHHRAIIGFDKNGIPKVLVPADVHSHTHVDENGNVIEHTHEDSITADYMQAVAAYRKTFPSKQDVIDNTPDPAVKEMILRAEQLGINTVFDRFDAQQPQCSFGLSGSCCRICTMGPCRITPKSPRGVCGADVDLIVSRQLLRGAAAGAAQHGMHAREVILSLKWAAEGKLDVPIVGEYKIRTMAEAFGIKIKNRQLKNITIDLCDALLEDLSRTEPGEYKTITACAPPERQKVWKDMDILPISAYHEVFEAYHTSGCATGGDWKSIMKQFLRCGLAFTFSGVVGTSIATDSLLGVGDRTTAKTNVGALKEGYVNIAVHGHLPVLVKEIVKTGYSEKFQKMAKDAGAKGIQFYGICCSGLSAMYRYAGVIPLSNAVSAEMVIGTGALDLWVADVQEVYPSIMDVAKCFKTTVVTTHDSGRLPGAEHIGYDHNHTNISETHEIAEKIVTRAIESFQARRGIPVVIPPYEVEAEVGFSVEYVCKRFGSMKPLADALKEGKILGIVNMVGCNNPKVMYEKAICDVADVLLKNNVLILTNGCASFPLMKMGYCQTSELAYSRVGDNLKEFLGDDLPPVWHVGECIDNARSSGIFAGVAGAAGHKLYEMPYAFTSPEWSNEKGIDAALGFRLMGINSYHCVEAQIHASQNVMEFLKDSTKETLGSVMYVDVDPVALGEKMVEDIKAKRKALGWD